MGRSRDGQELEKTFCFPVIATGFSKRVCREHNKLYPEQVCLRRMNGDLAYSSFANGFENYFQHHGNL